MKPEEFDEIMQALREHFDIDKGKTYGQRVTRILWETFRSLPADSFRQIVTEAIATIPRTRPPLRDQLREIANKLDVKTSSWAYFEVPDCLACGGVGWHYVHLPHNGGEAIVACDSCRAGKNMQIAPKGHISWTLAQCPGARYSRPGRAVRQHADVHPEIIRRWGSLEALQKAIDERRVSTAQLTREIITRAEGHGG